MVLKILYSLYKKSRFHKYFKSLFNNLLQFLILQFKARFVGNTVYIDGIQERFN